MDVEIVVHHSVSAKVQISYEIFAKLMEIFSKLMEIFAKLMEIFSPVSPSKKVALKTGNHIQRNVEIVSVLFYWSYIFLFITESKFDNTKYYTKSRMVTPIFLHDIKCKGKHFPLNNNTFKEKVAYSQEAGPFLPAILSLFRRRKSMLFGCGCGDF